MSKISVSESVVRLLVIGNGFDLAHELPTTYYDFLFFCKEVQSLYTSFLLTSKEDYYHNFLEEWKANEIIKNRLVELYDYRQVFCNGDYVEPDDHEHYWKAFDELHEMIENNAWILYFVSKMESNIGTTWIDFETEISLVVKAIEDALECNQKYASWQDNIQEKNWKLLIEVCKTSFGSMKDFIGSYDNIIKTIELLDSHLEKLIRALEIYLSVFVNEISIANKCEDITNIKIDRIISFNYTNTFERVYGKTLTCEYDYVHGKAEFEHSSKTCNMVVGIDEYLNDEAKNTNLEFVAFKKYFQRIYKSTSTKYLRWVDEMNDRDNETLNKKYVIYVFGHSLDVTDKDILRRLFTCKNASIKIIYYRKSEEDKTNLGKLIKNMVRLIGQDELIRRTSEFNKNIEFIPQTLKNPKI